MWCGQLAEQLNDAGLDQKVVFDAIEETLERTTLSERKIGDFLNVERSLRVGDELGGHVLSGHVISKAEIVEKKDLGEGMDVRISIPEQIRPFIMEKGYIGIDGMSLTVGICDGEGFSLHLIPETLRITTIGSKEVGETVNIEIDSRTQAIVETMLRMGEKA
ncbi:MAG: riboflavin synthase [Euryarchaeota archaeon]|nr:riboflavin synthase [Euryarchaeota archaeon]